MQVHQELVLDTLLAPIDGEGCGEDLSFSLLFDEIKEARRADPDYLSQGEWATDLKQSNWPQVVELTSEALAQQSKDLMLACWLCEALTHRDHFTGLAFGLHTFTQMAEQYWDGLFPDMEDGLDQRLSRCAWLDSTLAEVVSTLPLTQEYHYGLRHYQESRWVDNQALQNPEVMQQALDEGKINAEMFQRAVALSKTDFLRAHHRELKHCQTQLAELVDTLERLMGRDAPIFRELNEHLDQCRQLIERLLTERGEVIELVTEAPSVEEIAGEVEGRAAPSAGQASSSEQAALRTSPRTREEAFQLLNGVAQFFRQSEPHSPVPHLVERAIRWGRMPLEEWLRDVIREDAVIDSIRETLGTLRLNTSDD